ncbi:hypothetical protein BABINDRAFT_7450 [Babjeviella inositovora NRRL Y-12698]|uniref:Protein kinase domain-containing protein n=1 Tax=Babjeviella inositovora NRRL Y-12698 TaxID=984486 RepID=A0A1E3QTB4_9ASCO|nr:uncharacterized protein BABINDRAFT_7450 [Babjeviella inositovora NRRL Y-12698]ODQ80754.1 hypothetical protein BABINDRAFT_7450 [Babjeviella inositovora NRRL Y-12698]
MTATTDFKLLEGQKENIQPVKEGRSASALAATFSVGADDLRRNQAARRAEFEAAIVDSDEHDDPLEIYLDYLQWTKDNFPQGSNVESGLIQLLERCTLRFRDTEYYKNDARYLRVWLQYARYSDSPRDIFLYLAKKEIGLKLATYYEEFAHFLEVSGRKLQAQHIFNMGIDVQARPVTRLQKRYALFLERLAEAPAASNEPSHNILQPLAVKSGPSGGIGGEAAEPSDLLAIKRPKLQVFVDEDEPGLDGIGSKMDNWQSLGSIAERTKENRIKATPWAGEIMAVGKNFVKANKIAVFKDETQSSTSHGDKSNPVFSTIDTPGRRPERLDLNLELLYTPEEEFCLEEVYALSRGLRLGPLQMPVKAEPVGTEPVGTEPVGAGPVLEIEPTITLTLEQIPICQNSKTLHFEQSQTVSIPLKHDDRDQNRPGSPTVTMTFFSKAARGDVFDMFNQPAQPDKMNSDDTDHESATFNDYTETIHEIQDVEMEDVARRFTETNGGIQMRYINEVEAPERFSKEVEDPKRSSAATEDQKQSDEMSASNRYTGDDDVLSSPFLEQPLEPEGEIPDIRTLMASSSGLTVNPTDTAVLKRLLQGVSPAVSAYPGYFEYATTLGRADNLKKFARSSHSNAIGNKNAVIEFSQNHDIYCIRTELGEGGYATVYLAESGEGTFRALKVQKPSNSWEFYVLRQIYTRLNASSKAQDSKTLRSVIQAEGLHLYQDEGYLILSYKHQGTILDIVNFFRSRQVPTTHAVEEVMVVFLSIELLRTMESLHRIGIIHGDLKPDNCMVRFQSLAEGEWDSEYDREGSNGWSKKGITLIDFGRAVDMTLHPTGVQFVCDWETDNQDCPEMREGRTWTYEADYYGIASIMHTMLFGKTIETQFDRLYRISTPLKRYWQLDIWGPLFDLLLNPKKHARDGILPITDQLMVHREKMEDWLELHSTGDPSLKSVIQDVEQALSHLKK